MGVVNKTVLRKLGIRGVIKSVITSALHTDSVTKIALSRNTVTDISRKSDFEIQDRVTIGLRARDNAGHHRIGRSRLKLTKGSTFVAPSGPAQIGPCSVVCIEGGHFEMGQSYINSRAVVLCKESISIGDDCAIAWGVTLLDSDYHTYEIDGEQQPMNGSIDIGDNVWIGHDSTIKKGVKIGDDAIVASNSVVTQDVEPGTLVAGSPAREIQSDVRKTD